MQAVYRELAPGGTLRAAINLNSAVVERHAARNAGPTGLAIDLANELGRRLSVPTSLLGLEGVSGIVEAGIAGSWDVAFLAIDPVHTQHFAFTSPYIAFEGTYLVHDGSPNQNVLDLDREGVRIAVAEGATYDLYLTRTLRRARLVRSPTFKRALELFLSEGLDAVAGLKQALEAFATMNHGLHLINGRFAAIEHAIAVPEGHSAGLRYLKAFVDEMKAERRVGVAHLNRADHGTP
jgi:polar amino acid transport system substrate-binding protein